MTPRKLPRLGEAGSMRPRTIPTALIRKHHLAPQGGWCSVPRSRTKHQANAERSEVVLMRGVYLLW